MPAQRYDGLTKKKHQVRKNLETEREITGMAIRVGVLPIEVMLYEMRDAYDEAMKLKEAARRSSLEVEKTIEKLHALLSKPSREEEQEKVVEEAERLQEWARAAGHEMEVLLESRKEKMDRAVEMACLAAPYIHPKLSNLEAKIDMPPSQVTVNVANIQSDLAPYRDAVRALVYGELGQIGGAVSENGDPQPVGEGEAVREAVHVPHDPVS